MYSLVLVWLLGALLASGSASFLLGQAISIDAGSVTDQFFSPVPGFVTSVITPGASGDLTIRYGAFRYNIPSAPGPYDVKLFFRETGTVSAVGQRSFSVSINGAPVLVNFDLFAVAGLSETTRTFQATSSGFIGIDFTYSLRSAIVSRMELTPKLTPITNVPRQVSESLKLADDLSQGQSHVVFLLSNMPVPGSQLLVILQSSRLGQDKIVSALVDPLKPREMDFTLPEYRPFNGDLIQMVYWTLE